jgi:hypothetical protein
MTLNQHRQLSYPLSQRAVDTTTSSMEKTPLLGMLALHLKWRKVTSTSTPRLKEALQLLSELSPGTSRALKSVQPSTENSNS